MNPRSFLISLGLHVLLGLVVVWVGQARAPMRRPLPEATVVKLLNPASIIAPTPSKPTDEIKIPEPKTDKPPTKEQDVAPDKKSLEIPVKKPKEEAVTEETDRGSKGEASAPKVPKELVGEGVSLRLKNPGFEYDFYLGIVLSKLEQNFRPPPGKKTGSALVSLTIQKNGDITDVAIQQSSGDQLIDQAAQRAVRAAGHFPPLPAQYESGQLPINVKFVANPATGG